jgi:ATP/maltotriose-dependent transcriptional regulator MalT
MSEGLDEQVRLGRHALAAADWPAARSAFERAVAHAPEDPAALDGCAEALWWVGEWDRSREVREKAYARYRVLGRHLEAATAAIWLANEYIVAAGNRAAWNGWLERAAGLLEDAGPTVQYGWLLFTRGRRAEDPAEAVRACTEALQIAKRHGDPNLEVVSLSQIGRALVAMGRTEEGFARLDEAMAAVTGGEAPNHSAVCETCCNMLTTCESASEMERLSQWCRITDEVARRMNGLTIYSFCRLNYASVLLAMGRFGDAERQILESLNTARGFPAFAVHMYAKLAEVRLAQGRVAEAEEVLSGHEESSAAVRAVARLRIAKGEARAAANLLARRLTQVKGDSLQTAPLLALVVEARLALGEVGLAREAATELEALASAARRSACLAVASLASGLVALAEDDAGAAWSKLDAAREMFADSQMPLEAARARLAMARALAKDDPDAARDTARGARATLEALGAARDADRASELLRELGVGTAPGRRIDGTLSAREQDVLALLGSGLSNSDIGARLFISPKTVEHHVGRILAKLGLRNRAAAAAYAVKRPSRESGQK